MNGIKRTTRECSVTELNPQLLQALQDYFQEHNLGNLAVETVLCCETFTERNLGGKLAAWLDGNPDATDYLGLVLTRDRLLWARSGDRSGTIATGANLREIRVRAYSSRLTRETGLQIAGIVGDSGEGVRGNLALDAGPAAQKFCEQAKKAVEEANPPSKRITLPWFKR